MLYDGNDIGIGECRFMYVWICQPLAFVPQKLISEVLLVSFIFVFVYELTGDFVQKQPLLIKWKMADKPRPLVY